MFLKSVLTFIVFFVMERRNLRTTAERQRISAERARRAQSTPAVLNQTGTRPQHISFGTQPLVDIPSSAIGMVPVVNPEGSLQWDPSADPQSDTSTGDPTVMIGLGLNPVHNSPNLYIDQPYFLSEAARSIAEEERALVHSQLGARPREPTAGGDGMNSYYEQGNASARVALPPQVDENFGQLPRPITPLPMVPPPMHPVATVPDVGNLHQQDHHSPLPQHPSLMDSPVPPTLPQVPYQTPHRPLTDISPPPPPVPPRHASHGTPHQPAPNQNHPNHTQPAQPASLPHQPALSQLTLRKLPYPPPDYLQMQQSHVASPQQTQYVQPVPNRPQQHTPPYIPQPSSANNHPPHADPQLHQPNSVPQQPLAPLSYAQPAPNIPQTSQQTQYFQPVPNRPQQHTPPYIPQSSSVNNHPPHADPQLHQPNPVPQQPLAPLSYAQPAHNIPQTSQQTQYFQPVPNGPQQHMPPYIPQPLPPNNYPPNTDPQLHQPNPVPQQPVAPLSYRQPVPNIPQTSHFPQQVLPHQQPVQRPYHSANQPRHIPPYRNVQYYAPPGPITPQRLPYQPYPNTAPQPAFNPVQPNYPQPVGYAQPQLGMYPNPMHNSQYHDQTNQVQNTSGQEPHRGDTTYAMGGPSVNVAQQSLLLEHHGIPASELNEHTTVSNHNLSHIPCLNQSQIIFTKSKADLCKFSGDLEDFPEWKATFTASLPMLTKESRLSTLKECLDARAKQVIAGFSGTAESTFIKAMIRLDERYNHPDQVLHLLEAKVNELVHVDCSNNENLFAKIVSQIREKYDRILSIEPIAVLRLDTNLYTWPNFMPQQMYNRYIRLKMKNKVHTKLSFTGILKECEDYCAQIDYESLCFKGRRKQQSRQVHSTIEFNPAISDPEQIDGMVNYTSNSSKPYQAPTRYSCNLCQTNDHKTAECTAEFSPKELAEMIYKYKLCKLCGTIGHFARYCPILQLTPDSSFICKDITCGSIPHSKRFCSVSHPIKK